MNTVKIKMLSRNIFLLSLITLLAGCGGGGIEKYTTPGKTTNQQFEDFRDNGGITGENNKWNGFTVASIQPYYKNGIMNAVELTVQNSRYVFALWGGTSLEAVSPKMIRSTLSDYCGIKDDAWETSALGGNGSSNDKKMTCGYSVRSDGYIVSMSLND